ncbi:S8 family peptidase [Vallitalea okinawensis]|uniref:S8 family peptidase n=1 Tax=Vallitalea okinawensis TaxID=2078660 RepID=UPI000CFD0B72|nr:S8 family peptidase [Vallitalea okinawensis]
MDIDLRQEDLNEELNCHYVITSEDYVDIYYRMKGNIEEAAKQSGAVCVQDIVDGIPLFHIKMEPEDCQEFYFNSEYLALPNLYGLSSISSIEAAGIGPVIKSESLAVTGNGVLVGIIDTGIDYTHEAFIYEDNTSKVVNIWDQTLAGSPPEGFLYGTEYSQEQINEALQSEDPLSIVPSTDEIGHGTFLAGLAAGRPKRSEKFQGAAPDADLIVVKLKQAKKCIKDFFQVKDGAIAYETNDIYQATKYILAVAKKFKKPIVILYAFASSDGPHNGKSKFEEFLAQQGDSIGVVIITSAGNEANTDHHYRGIIPDGENKDKVEMNVAENEKGVFLNAWIPLPDKFSIEIISPTGNTTGIFPLKSRTWQDYTFALEGTMVHVHYDLLDERAGGEIITVIINKPSAGLWTLVIHGETVINGVFDIYLPTKGFIEDDTIFLKPDPNITVVIPSTNPGTITVGAYNEVINSIYFSSGRGYTRENRVKPDIVAPGVNAVGPYPNNQYGVMSGTSVSSAITAGASALILEWGIVKGNDLSINTTATKAYLVRGANRKKGLKYPNREWGFGELDLLNTFKEL